jgi:hypothetical protein
MYSDEREDIINIQKLWRTVMMNSSATVKEEGDIDAADLPPYFMTLTEAVKFLRRVGFNVIVKGGADVTDSTIAHWETIIEKHNGG